MKCKRSAAIVCALAVAAAGITAVAATQGSQEDPLLTLSYLDKVLRPQLEEQVTAAVEANRSQLQTQLEQAAASYESRVDETLASAGTGAFLSKTLAQGDSFTPGAGREFLLTSGGATALGSLTDTTAGRTVQAGESLAVNHLYLTADQSSGCKATSAAAVMSR